MLINYISTMKKILLFVCGFLFSISLFSQELDWLTQMSTSDYIHIHDIAVDKDDNVFITGYIEGIVDFDISAAGGTLTSYYGSWYSEDPFVAKYDADGNYLWARHIYSAQGLGSGNSLAVDAFGNVYVAGSQYNGGLACFLARYTAAGTQTYYYTMNGYETSDKASIITLDKSGNLYYFQRFEGTNTDLDPTGGTSLHSAVGGYDAYFAKFTASTGAFQWVKTFGGSGYEEPYDIETDGTYLYVCGGFSSTVDFNPDGGVVNRTTIGNTDIFVARYLCSTGAYDYVYTYGGSSYDRGYNLELETDYLYFMCQYTGTIDFQQGAGTFNLTSANSGADSSYPLFRMRKSDLTVDWGYNTPFENSVPSLDIYQDGILVSHYFYGTDDFDPGAGVENLTSPGSYTPAVLYLNSLQEFQWVVAAANPTSASYKKNICVDNSNGFFFADNFSTNVTVDPDGNSQVLNSTSGTDAYVSHWKVCIPVTITTQPNPSTAAICEGNTQMYSVAATGTAPIYYQWYRNGSLISGATSNSYSASQSGSYYCEISNACSSENSNSANLTVNTNVSISSATASSSPICSSATTNITANGIAGTGASHTWYTGSGGTGSNLGSSNPLNVGPGTYYARVTGTCGSPVEALVTVDSYTDVSISSATASSSPICSSATTNITANGIAGTGASLTWYTGPSGTGSNLGSSNPLNVGPGTYYARVTGTCGSPVEASVTVDSYIDVSISSATASSSPICSSSTTNITANGIAGTGASLNWYTGPSGTGTNLGSSNPLNVGPGTYYARVTGTCGSPVEASVTVDSYTDVSISSATALSSPICSASTTNITANGIAGTGASFNWYTGPGGTGSNLGSSNPLNVGPGTYYARVTGTCGSPVETSVTVVSDPLPTASAGDSQTICSNGTATVSGASSSNGNILWSHIGSGLLTDATTLTPTYTASSGDAGNSVILTMTVTSDNACTPQTATASYTVNVDPLPTASAGGSQTICPDGIATVSGAFASNGTIFWTEDGAGSITSGATTLTPTYNAAAVDAGSTVTLTMTVTSDNACNPQTAIANYTVNVGALPSEPTLAQSDRIGFCGDDIGSINLSVIGGSGDDVHWFDDACGGNEIGLGNPLTINSPVATTTYYARWENSCGVSTCESVVVDVAIPPIAPTSAASDLNNICADDSGNIELSVVGGSGTTVQWFTSSCGGTSIGSGNPLSLPSPDVTTSYYAYWETSCGVSACVEHTVNVLPLPVAPTNAIVDRNDFCSDDSGDIELSVNGGSGDEVHWFNDACGGNEIGTGNPLVISSPENTTTYFARWENSCGQSSCEFIQVNVISVPEAPTFVSSDRNNLCVDDAGTINLSAVGGSGTTIHWYTGSCVGTEIGIGNPLNIESPTVTTEYFASWENTCGFSDCESVTVTIIDAPTDPTSADVDIASVCEDDTGNISLSVTGGSGPEVQWYSESCGGTSVGTGNPLVILSPTVSTTYYARYESSCGNSICVSVDVDVTLLPTAPTLAESNLNNICSNDDGDISLSITGGSGDEVHWFDDACGGNEIGTGNPLIIPSPENTTTYYARWENSCGVSTCQNITVITVQAADATINQVGPFCDSDGSVVLTSGDPGGTWAGDAVDPVTGLFNPAAAGAGDHLITCSFAGTCPDSDEITISVVDSFDSTIDEVDDMCSDDAEISLVAVDTGGTWSGTGITDASLGTFNPSVAGVGTHTITYTYVGACGSSDDVEIVINQSADATITPVGPFCVTDDPIVVTGAQVGGTWSGTAIDPVTGFFDPEVAGAGDHVITYTVLGDCGDTDEVTITVLEIFDATIDDVGSLCEKSEPITLTATTVGGIWSGDGITDEDEGVFNPNIAGPGSHTITYEYEGSCGSSDDVVIVVNPQSNAAITSVGPFCEDAAPVVLVAAEIGGTWSGTGVDPTTGFFDPQLAGVGEHQITYTISSECGDADQITVSILEYADATIGSDLDYCIDGNTYNLLAVDGGGIWTGTSLTEDGVFDPEAAGEGTYEIIYTIGGLCGDSDTVSLNVYPIADASISAVDPLTEEDMSVELNVAELGGVWEGIFVDEFGVFNPIEAGVASHQVIYTIEGVCGDSDTIDIIVISASIDDILVPTVITPDNDGYNDTWQIPGIEAYNQISIRIFTRWGDEVFVYDGSGEQYTEMINQWDGKRQDNDLPSGSYVYILIINNDLTYKGTISLIR